MAQQTRPPIVTIMGHVDHGKTTLLDYIRKANVQEGEAGGITQHIGAYQVTVGDDATKKAGTAKTLTFIDTPGHAAFNKMRQRGANITDIVILVVAGNDGVKPQTIESIRFIKNSNVPFLVAINKMDLKDINLDIVRSQLAEHDVIVTEYNGDIETVEISAKTGKGVDKLLETVSVMAELLELKADAEKSLEAVVIESTKDPKKGSLARVIVQQGTLKVRQDLYVYNEDDLSADEIKGRVRFLTNETGDRLTDVMPGSPAEIVGLKDVPEVGSTIREVGGDYTVVEEKLSPEDQKIADELSELDIGDNSDVNSDVNSESGTNGGSDSDADSFDSGEMDWESLDFDAAFGEKTKLKLIVRTDVKGTLEAITETIDPDSVDLLSAGVGQVTETDLEMADIADALIIAFHIKVPRKIKGLAKKMGVKVKEYDVIYHLIEDLQKQMLKILEPTIDEVVTGEAEIMQIFDMKGDRIAGIKVKTGELKKNDLFHLKRGDEIIGNPVIKSMMHGKEEITSVKAKNEAGLVFKNKRLEFEVGDIVVAYRDEG